MRCIRVRTRSPCVVGTFRRPSYKSSVLLRASFWVKNIFEGFDEERERVRDVSETVDGRRDTLHSPYHNWARELGTPLYSRIDHTDTRMHARVHTRTHVLSLVFAWSCVRSFSLY